jgi:hypothetical protein
MNDETPTLAGYQNGRRPDVLQTRTAIVSLQGKRNGWYIRPGGGLAWISYDGPITRTDVGESKQAVLAASVSVGKEPKASRVAIEAFTNVSSGPDAVTRWVFGIQAVPLISY